MRSPSRTFISVGRSFGQRVVRPGDLHKAHIPTGVVPLGAVVRLATAELGVAPLRADWDDVLRRAESEDRGGSAP